MAHEATLHLDNRALLVESPVGRVRIDASAHAIFARVDGVTWELGASRAGIQAVAEATAKALELEDMETPRICSGVLDALRMAAAHRGMDLGEAATRILGVRETPLIFSAPFLAAGYLRDDATRFAACRAAIAGVEGERDDEETLEGTAALVERLQKWRKLYLVGGSSKKVMNRALTIVDDAYDPAAVWGLRRVKLSRAPETRVEVELLGALGAHPRHAALENHVKLVERTPPQDLELALDVVERGLKAQVFVSSSPAHLAAELLAWISVGPKTGLRRALETAMGEAHAAIRDDTPTAKPPIKLPASQSIHFLDSVQAIVDEGRRMRHCVATLAQRAVDGDTYLFHIAMGAHRATAEVSPRGHVVQIRGPRNAHNAACDVGGRILKEWGRDLGVAFARQRELREERAQDAARVSEEREWLEGLSLDASIWLGPRKAPRGANALRSVRELLVPYAKDANPARRQAYRCWAAVQVAAAREGRAWLVSREIAGSPAIAVLDADGRVVDRFRWT